MGIDLAGLTKISPYLYHVTYEASLGRIRSSRRLESAAVLLAEGGQSHRLRMRRDSLVEFVVDGEPIVLTDQSPVNPKNIAFQGGWSLPDLVEALNSRVFFWRGGLEGLLKANQKHFGKYKSAGHRMIFLRLNFDETIKLNNQRGPELCNYNSGAARQSKGKPIPRGATTFVQPHCADFEAGEVQEVVFRGFVDLPATTEICHGSWEGPWQSLFHDGQHDA